MINYMQNIRQFFIYTIANIFILYLYQAISGIWVSIGGSTLKVFVLEFPLIIFMLSFLFFNKIENKIYKYILPILPIIIIYIGVDIFYSFLARSPLISDLQNLYAAIYFLPLLGIILIILCILFTLPLIILIYQASRYYSKKTLTISVLCRFLIISLCIFSLFSNLFHQLQKTLFIYNSWSQKDVMHANGRINSFIFYTQQNIQNKIKLATYFNKDINVTQNLYPGKLNYKPNIHLIVLESFIDPRMLKNIAFDKSPLAINLEKYLHNKQFSRVISSIYGGGTAQSEFELLTGIKAYAKVNSIEFNIMTGSQIQAF